MARGTDTQRAPLIHRGPRTYRQTEATNAINAGVRRIQATQRAVVNDVAPVVDPTESYSKMDELLRRYVNSELYRYVIFVSNPETLNPDGDLFKVVQFKLGYGQGNVSNDDDTFFGWWNTTGQKIFVKVLNAKRTTLSNAIKKIAKKMFREHMNDLDNPNKSVPKPDELFEYSQDPSGNRKIRGLRENKERYTYFLLKFGKAVFGKGFEEFAVSRRLSNFFPPGLEAFLLIAYDNGYQMWCQGNSTAQNFEDVDGSDITDSDESERYINEGARFKYTNHAQGARKGEGWSKEGKIIYDALHGEIIKQREDDKLGNKFEKDFMFAATGKNVSNGKVENKNDLAHLMRDVYQA